MVISDSINQYLDLSFFPDAILCAMQPIALCVRVCVLIVHTNCHYLDSPYMVLYVRTAWY